MQEENNVEHTNGMCQASMLVSKRKIILSMIMPSVMCLCYSQIVDHCVT